MPALLDQYERPLPSPAKAARREEFARVARRIGDRVQARYDAAQTTTDNENHWARADGLSAAAANSPQVRRTLRNRARYEVANNSYAAGMVRTIANDAIGTGPALQMASGDDEADSAVEVAFYEWAQAIHLPLKLRTMRSARCVDGESFGLLFSNLGLPHAVKLDLKLYETDQVARSILSYVDPKQSDGILFDDFGNPVAYTLLRRHPGDSFFVDTLGESDTIPAASMIHYFRPERAGQVRGVPEMTPALPLYAQLRRYTLAVIAAAETAADIAGFIHTQQSPDDPDDLEPLDTLDIERRMLMTLPAGWTVNQLKAEQPATTYEMFKAEILNEIARCLNMPFNVAAGNSSNYNYASGRLDHKVYFKSLRVERFEIERIVLDRLFAAWWAEARMVGVLPDAVRDQKTPPNHEWRWDGDEHVDPLKEANAQSIRLASHTTTLAREFGRQGLDWEDELRQRAKEATLMGELGLTASADSGLSAAISAAVQAAVEESLSELEAGR